MELLIALLLAQTMATLAAPRKYYFGEQPATWHQAQSYCRERFGDLATIENDEDMAEVQNMLADSGVTKAWIGLYNDVESWRWSLDNSFPYAAGNTGFGNWLEFVANNDYGNENCVVHNNDKLADNKCSAPRASVCYKEPSNEYIPVPTEMNWTSAQSNCRNMYTDLASIRNKEELQQVKALGLNRYWIGLYREGWRWSDQSGSRFRAWAGAEPTGVDNTCAFANAYGMHAAPSDMTYHFICSAPVKRTVKVVVKSSGYLDLNDPIIQDAILDQVKMDIKKLGIQQKIRVTWNKQPTGKVFTLTAQP